MSGEWLAGADIKQNAYNYISLRISSILTKTATGARLRRQRFVIFSCKARCSWNHRGGCAVGDRGCVAAGMKVSREGALAERCVPCTSRPSCRLHRKCGEREEEEGRIMRSEDIILRKPQFSISESLINVSTGHPITTLEIMTTFGFESGTRYAGLQAVLGLK